MKSESQLQPRDELAFVYVLLLVSVTVQVREPMNRIHV